VLPAPRHPSTLLRVATLNLWGEFAQWPHRLAILAEAWPCIDADALLMQEVRRHGALDQLQQVSEALALPHVHDVRATPVEGVAVASRLPLAPVAVPHLPRSEPAREAAVAEVSLEGGVIRIICAHVTFRPVRTQRAQLHALARMASGPTLLAGDFNATPGAVRPHLPGYAWAVEGQDTWPMIDPATFRRAWRDHIGRSPRFPLDTRQLDYVLTRDLMILQGGSWIVGKRDDPASDHALLWADVTLSMPA